MTTAKDFECRRISVTICTRKGETEIKCLRIVYADKEKSSCEFATAFLVDQPGLEPGTSRL